MTNLDVSINYPTNFGKENLRAHVIKLKDDVSK